MPMNNRVTIALTKGRLLQETLPLLSAIGIAPLEDLEKSRKLVFATTMASVQLVVLRGSDVPTYVQFGTADMGVSGKDVILEHGGEGFYEPLDLGIARCRLMTAGVVGAAKNQDRIRVATKFVNIARRYYAEQGRQVDVIKLYGAMELPLPPPHIVTIRQDHFPESIHAPAILGDHSRGKEAPMGRHM